MQVRGPTHAAARSKTAHDRDTHEERQTVWMHLEVEELASPSVRDVSVPITVPVKRNRFGRLYDVPMFSGFLWSEWQDLNLRPPRPEGRGKRCYLE